MMEMSSATLSSTRREADEATAMTVDWGRAVGPGLASVPMSNIVDESTAERLN